MADLNCTAVCRHGDNLWQIRVHSRKIWRAGLNENAIDCSVCVSFEVSQGFKSRRQGCESSYKGSGSDCLGS